MELPSTRWPALHGLAIRLFVGLLALIGHAASSDATEAVTYYYSDPQGTVLAKADGSGNVIARSDYRPFGEVASGISEAGPGFAAHMADSDSGLIYMQARYYDPLIARFLSTDPVAVGDGDTIGFGRYLYAANNPILNIDPDGRQSCVAEGCTVGPTQYNFFRDNPLGAIIGHTIGDPIALARSDNFNPLTSNRLWGAEIQDAKLGVLTLFMPASKPEKIAGDVAKEVVLTLSQHGEAAQHAAAAIAKGYPDVLTINRVGATANRRAATGGYAKVTGKELDEYPPAMFKEGGRGASVQAINLRDNRAAGACVGNMCRGLPDGTQIRIKVDLNQ
ncbi:RHS repeat-associated core domain-containing protein [Luteibacter sp. RCC_6_2]|uniref:RHS repeat-associated core domain-containing protein n=1 Tax=Luteibacter sp. RCC_6_2 TaxID=3239223 RepID=UPI0035236E32